MLVIKEGEWYLAVVNGIIVKKSKVATKLLQWVIDHVDDNWFDITEVKLKERRKQG